MTVVAQLGIAARAKRQMAATGDLGFWLAAMLRRRHALRLRTTWRRDPVGRPRRRSSLIAGPALLAIAGVTALALTFVLGQSAQAPLAFVPPILGGPRRTRSCSLANPAAASPAWTPA